MAAIRTLLAKPSSRPWPLVQMCSLLALLKSESNRFKSIGREPDGLFAVEALGTAPPPTAIRSISRYIGASHDKSLMSNIGIYSRAPQYNGASSQKL